MLATSSMCVGYVLKMYPRFSETFIVNEILAHEAAGLPVEIFSLRLPIDGRFHENYARVQAPVTYLSVKEQKAGQFWQALELARCEFPALWGALHANVQLEAGDVCQAIELARLIRGVASPICMRILAALQQASPGWRAA
jgi:hypothetical protein